jgi:hypothetical protein
MSIPTLLSWTLTSKLSTHDTLTYHVSLLYLSLFKPPNILLLGFKTLFRSYAAGLGGLSLLMLYTIFANFSIPIVYYTRRTLCFAFIIPLLNINLNPLYTYTFCQPRIPYTSPAILANFASTCPGYTRRENGTIDPSDYIAYVPHLVRQSLYDIYSTRRFFEQTNPTNGSEVIHALAAAYDAYNTTHTAQTQYVRDLATAIMPFEEVTGAFLAAIQRQQGILSNRTDRRPTSDTCPPSWSTFPPLVSPARTIFNPSVHPLAPHYISLLYTLHRLPSPPLPPVCTAAVSLQALTSLYPKLAFQP